jgi:hypothetical protein
LLRTAPARASSVAGIGEETRAREVDEDAEEGGDDGALRRGGTAECAMTFQMKR